MGHINFWSLLVALLYWAKPQTLLDATKKVDLKQRQRKLRHQNAGQTIA
jgi:hypothetical protein